MSRPEINRNLNSDTFRSYYYLKEELTEFCGNNGLPASGGKMDLINRISHFLDTGEVLQVKTQAKVKSDIGEITENSKIEANFVCSERHRAFFKEKIGNSFSFNVTFQKWLKSNTGKAYGQAIEAYHIILEEKKSGKSDIDKQFEYNTYIRDFFADNNGRTLKDAIKCWNYKKGLQGHNLYEKEDLKVLKQVLD